MILTVSRQLGAEEQRILPCSVSNWASRLSTAMKWKPQRNGWALSRHVPKAPRMSACRPSTGLRGLLNGPTRYAEALTRTVQELARTQSAILVGTAGAEILRDDPQALHIRLVARREDRIRRISEEADVDAEHAARLIDESDHQPGGFPRYALWHAMGRTRTIITSC